MNRFLFLFLLGSQSLFASVVCLSDTGKVKKKGSFYLLWGYNREVYTKSTIHFQNKTGDPNATNEFGIYDFRIYDAVAHDKPDFDQLYDVINITIPQFNGRIGYYFNNSKDWGIEMNYDHAKYVVTDGQTLHIKGTILGQYVDKDTTLTRDNFHFEHTDGANFWMLNVLKRWKLYSSKNERNTIGLVLKPGLGIVVPRTDVTIFRDRVNNNWKIAGAIAGIETGIRAELWNHLAIEFTGKATYANYMNCLVQGKGHGSAQHMFGALQGILTFGYQFGWGYLGKNLK
ncbi:MAG: hypothetical protein ACJ76F_12225 [Bacteroidia bacterium]